MRAEHVLLQDLIVGLIPAAVGDHKELAADGLDLWVREARGRVRVTTSAEPTTTHTHARTRSHLGRPPGEGLVLCTFGHSVDRIPFLRAEGVSVERLSRWPHVFARHPLRGLPVAIVGHQELGDG